MERNFSCYSASELLENLMEGDCDGAKFRLISLLVKMEVTMVNRVMATIWHRTTYFLSPEASNVFIESLGPLLSDRDSLKTAHMLNQPHQSSQQVI